MEYGFLNKDEINIILKIKKININLKKTKQININLKKTKQININLNKDDIYIYIWVSLDSIKMLALISKQFQS